MDRMKLRSLAEVREQPPKPKSKAATMKQRLLLQRAATLYAVLTLTTISSFAQQPNPDRNAYFGETHVHTSWSLDAFAIGNILTTPGDAYKYFKGEPIKHPLGFEVKIDTPLRTTHATANLPALLGAYIELRGAAGIEQAEKLYLTDLSRTKPEIEAALVALKVHGESDGAARERVNEALKGSIKQNPSLANLLSAGPGEAEIKIAPVSAAR
jgi:Protein of unknown function (DUF3604)